MSAALPHDARGQGPAVLLLHAGIADRRMWSEQLAPLSAAGFRVIAADLPGFGEAPAGFDPPPWAAVLHTLDALGIERAVLIGNSFGGAVALRVAALAPERVRGLVLVSAPPPVLDPSPELQAAWAAEETALEAEDLDGATEAVLAAWTRPDAPQAVRDRVAVMQRHIYELGFAADLDEADEPADPLEEDPALLAAVSAPALIIDGPHDFIDFRDGAQTLAAALPHARRATIPEAGHLAPLETPEAFTALVLAFLDGLPD